MAAKKKQSKKPALNPKQTRFCHEYIVDSNGTQAAIRAGYSEKTCNEQAARMLAKVSIKDLIAKLTEKALDKTELTVAKVLKNIEEMRKMATGDKNYGGMGKAIEMQAKFLKMLTEKTELTGANGGPLEITELSEQERVNRIRQLTRRKPT